MLASAEMGAEAPYVGLRVAHKKLERPAIAVARLERETSQSIHRLKSYQTITCEGTLRG